MRSFDLFDTLLGRYHYRPNSIFALVEKNYPFPLFSLYRTTAALKSDGTLKDIYLQMQKMIDLTDAECQLLMEFELETELSQVFPIQANLAQVEDGDLIVSDTYYTKEQIEKILQKINFTKRVKIYATPGGKSSSAIWPQLKEKYAISSHMGDSLKSDCMNPKTHGIDAFWMKDSTLSVNEQAVGKMGHDQLMCLMRTLRLLNPYPPFSAEWLFWNEESQLNTPLLLNASNYVHEFCQTHGIKKILFTARDCCKWIHLFRALYPQYESIYFAASRNTYQNPTPSYIEYVKRTYTENSLILDVYGSGKTCQNFFKQHMSTPANFLSLMNWSPKNHAILRARGGVYLEMLNYDVCGALCDVQGDTPIRAVAEYPVELIRATHECVSKCVEILPHFTLEAFDRKLIKWAVRQTRLPLVIEYLTEHVYNHL